MTIGFLVPPKCDATCLVHWNGVLPACAQSDGEMGICLRAAPLVNVAELRRDVAHDAVQGQHLVERALRSAFGARAVVADDVDDEGVVHLAHVFDGLNQPAHLIVGVLGKAGEDLHLPREETLLLGRH